MTRTIQQVGITEIHESAFNARKTFRGMEDLTASIGKDGVLQPLLLRPRKPEAGYEVVYGARRLRAAKAAGLTVLPAEVQDLDEPTAQRLQTVENDQREDLDPLERAAGYRHLRDRCKMDVAAIAEAVSKSKASVYAALKLAECIKPVQQELERGNITASHAVLLARLQPKQQQSALRQLDKGASVAHLEQHIARHFHRSLAGAAWQQDDAALVPKAGTCAVCPKRAGNNRDLYPSLKADTCTDTACFDAKLAAVIAQKRAAPGGDKLVQISTEYYRTVAAGVIRASRYVEAQKNCAHRLPAIIVAGDRIAQTTYICTNQKCAVHHPQQPSKAEKARRAAAKLERAVTGKLLDAVCAKVTTLTTEHLRAIGHRLAYDPVFAKCPETRLPRLLVRAALEDDHAAVRAAAKRYRIDVAKIRREVQAAAKAAGKPKPAAKPPAKPKAKAKAKKRK